eukprot:4085113-Alexandrium_andersonii.AAC.1
MDMRFPQRRLVPFTPTPLTQLTAQQPRRLVPAPAACPGVSDGRSWLAACCGAAWGRTSSEVFLLRV